MNDTTDSPTGQMEANETLPIIYQDEAIVAIHKPAGLLVHKSPIDKRETRYAMRILRDQLGQWVYPVHRLDKPTSGILLFALDADTARILAEQFEHRRVQKQYLALVRGFTPSRQTIDHPLSEIAAFKSDQAKADAKESKPATTELSTLKHYELPFADGRFPTSRYSLVKLAPRSGRKHQLRRHMKHISHPIIGDVKYGKGTHNRRFRDTYQCERLMLAATDLALEHPTSGSHIVLTCAPQPSFEETLNQIEGCSVSQVN